MVQVFLPRTNLILTLAALCNILMKRTLFELIKLIPSTNCIITMYLILPRVFCGFELLGTANCAFAACNTWYSDSILPQFNIAYQGLFLALFLIIYTLLWFIVLDFIVAYRTVPYQLSKNCINFSLICGNKGSCCCFNPISYLALLTSLPFRCWLCLLAPHTSIMSGLAHSYYLITLFSNHLLW